jgi:hypothetical protein
VLRAHELDVVSALARASVTRHARERPHFYSGSGAEADARGAAIAIARGGELSSRALAARAPRETASERLGRYTPRRCCLERSIPIITDGYDYALPDGRGFLGRFLFLPGPWLEPGFRVKKHTSFNRNRDVIVSLMDRFNAMLTRVSAYPDFAHVHYLDLRGTLKHGAGYKADWANELHPTGDGFQLVAAKFNDLIRKVS